MLYIVDIISLNLESQVELFTKIVSHCLGMFHSCYFDTPYLPRYRISYAIPWAFPFRFSAHPLPLFDHRVGLSTHLSALI